MTTTHAPQTDLADLVLIAREQEPHERHFVRRATLSHHIQALGLYSVYCRQVHGVWQAIGDIRGAAGFEKLIVDLGREVTERQAKRATLAIIDERLAATRDALLARNELPAAALPVLLAVYRADKTFRMPHEKLRDAATVALAVAA